MSKDEKRYVVTVDMYVYGEDDYMARKNTYKMLDKIDKKYPNARPLVTELGEQPFATMSYRKLDDHSKPIPKVKDKPLPFKIMKKEEQELEYVSIFHFYEQLNNK